MIFIFSKRMLKKLVFTAFLLILIQASCFAENKQKMDSLKLALTFEKTDTSKLKIYIELLQECDQKNNLNYGNLLIDFVDKRILLITNQKVKKKFSAARINALLAINNTFDRKKDSIPQFTYLLKKQQYYLNKKDIEGYVHITKILANEYRVSGDILKSVLQYKAGINIVKKYDFKIGEGMLLDGLTKNFLIIGDTAEALLNLNKAIAVYEQEGDSAEQAAGYRMLGSIYGLKNKALYAKSAINYFEKSRKINALIKNDEGYFLSLNGLANLYAKYNEYGLALNTYNQALSFASEKSMLYEVTLTYQNIGIIYLTQKNIDLARSNINAALEIANEFKIKDRIVYGKKYLSDTYFIEKKYAIAKKLMNEAAEENNIHGNEETRRDFELRLYRIDSAANNYREALEHYQKYIQSNKKLNSEELKKITLQEKYSRDYEMKKAIDKAEQVKKDDIVKFETQRKNTILIFVTIGFVIVLIFATFIYRSLGIRKKQNKLIETQKTAIESSYKNLELLNNISNEITSSLNLTSVMELIYKNVSALMDVSFFIISTYNELENTVEIKYSVKQGKVVDEEFKTTIMNPNSYIAKTIQSKKEIIVLDEDVERSKYLDGPSTLHGKEDLETKSHIFIPLFLKDKVIGLFSVQSLKKSAYTNTQIDVLRSLAPVIAVALNNAEAYHKIDHANVEITAQKKIVEEKQKEILDSIAYALRIQTAILPPQKIVKQHLENSFILYKPKDIVAGDFYWMETVQLADGLISGLANENKFKNNQLINSSANQLILFAACDCTGHGVPGAMVSVVCHNALNRAVREFGLTKPAEILDKTQEIVLENFSKSEEDIKDGMDISLCALHLNKVQNFDKVTLQWSGANNPLWLVHNGEFIEIKADKQPIGMNEDSKSFTNHTFELALGDTIYIFSDGYADQFSPTDKKLMKKNFKNLLLSMQDKNMYEQHDYLNTYIENWKGNMEQTDDILVIGVRV